MINQEFCNLFLRYGYIKVTYLLYWFMFFFRLFNIFLKLARSSNDINVTTETYLELLQNHLESLINPTTKKNNSSLMLDWLLILLSQILEQPGILNDLPTFVWQYFVWIFFPWQLKFPKWGLDRISIFRGELLGNRGWIFSGGCSFYLKIGTLAVCRFKG